MAKRDWKASEAKWQDAWAKSGADGASLSGEARLVLEAPGPAELLVFDLA